jgi:PqqD family protein of HPr-rel-A system
VTLYRAEEPEALLEKTLDGFTLIYHRRSGQTHFLASPMPEILDALGKGPGRVADVHDRLAGEFDLGARDAAQAVLTEHIDALVALGLVRAA